MSIPVLCRKCGYRGISRTLSISNSRYVTISNCLEQCPRCGGAAELQSGTYDFVGDVMTAFRAPGMSRQKVVAIADIVSKAAAGKISPDVAVQEAEGVESGLAALLRAAFAHGIPIDRIVAIIGLILAFWIAYSSDADAQKALAEDRKQTELLQQILDATEARPEHTREPSNRRPKVPPVRAEPIKTQNRHDRRKEIAVERRARASSKGTTMSKGN